MDDLFSNISADELRRYMQQRRENEYLLVDVRQPNEYAEGHLPGAVLIPLGEISQRMNELPVDKDIVFYCRSGKRSQGAAIFVGSRPSTASTVFNLTGGILAWNGHILADIHNLKIFDSSGSVREVLMKAMDLERGAERFYSAISLRYSALPWAGSVASLAGAEEAHARLIYRFWTEGQDNPPDFETVYSGLSGDIVEGGLSFSQLMDTLEQHPLKPCRAVLETALSIEYAAYDLYRSVAHRFQGERMEEVCNTIAEAEKEHMRFVAKALSLCDA